jgi:hypothetical protein
MGPLGRRRSRWEDGIKINLEEIICDNVERSHLAQERVQWRALVNMVTKFLVPWKTGNLLTSCSTISFSRRTLLGYLWALYLFFSVPYTLKEDYCCETNNNQILFIVLDVRFLLFSLLLRFPFCILPKKSFLPLHSRMFVFLSRLSAKKKGSGNGV